MLRLILAGLAAFALSGCTTTIVAHCPAIVPYTKGQQAEAHDELLALPPGSILPQFMLDYGELRERLRACKEASGD